MTWQHCPMSPTFISVDKRSGILWHSIIGVFLIIISEDTPTSHNSVPEYCLPLEERNAVWNKPQNNLECSSCFFLIKLTSAVALRPIQQHMWSDIHFNSVIRDMFRPTIAAVIRRYYKNMKGKTDETKRSLVVQNYWSLIWLTISRPPRLQYYSNLNWLILSRPPVTLLLKPELINP